MIRVLSHGSEALFLSSQECLTMFARVRLNLQGFVMLAHAIAFFFARKILFSFLEIGQNVCGRLAYRLRQPDSAGTTRCMGDYG